MLWIASWRQMIGCEKVTKPSVTPEGVSHVKKQDLIGSY